MNHLPLWLLAVGVALSNQRLARAQPTVTLYNTVSQPPHLPGTGPDPGFQAMEELLLRNFHYPAGVRPQQVTGVSYLVVAVTPAGKVTTTEFDQSIGTGTVPTAVEGAILQALRQLPALLPARYARRSVEAKLAITWTFSRSQPAPHTPAQNPVVNMRVSVDQLLTGIDALELSGEPTNPPPDVDPSKTYTYVEQMPRLPNGSGNFSEIVNIIMRSLVLPATAQEGRVFVSFVVDQQGKVGEAKIVKGLGAVTDAAVLAAVRRLPTFFPGTQNKTPVRVSITLPITVHLASKRPLVQPIKR